MYFSVSRDSSVVISVLFIYFHFNFCPQFRQYFIQLLISKPQEGHTPNETIFLPTTFSLEIFKGLLGRNFDSSLFSALLFQAATALFIASSIEQHIHNNHNNRVFFQKIQSIKDFFGYKLVAHKMDRVLISLAL
jgi:hypothetical protein